jgi:hypothetical protein
MPAVTLDAVPELQMVIDEEPPRYGTRWHEALIGRRLLLATVLAAVEAVLLLVWRPAFVWVLLGAVVLLALAVGLLSRVPAGIGRDALLIAGGAQAIVIGVPLALGFGVLVAVIAAVVLIAGLVFVAVAKRS